MREALAAEDVPDNAEPTISLKKFKVLIDLYMFLPPLLPS
jgi:hypothetical protein